MRPLLRTSAIALAIVGVAAAGPIAEASAVRPGPALVQLPPESHEARALALLDRLDDGDSRSALYRYGLAVVAEEERAYLAAERYLGVLEAVSGPNTIRRGHMVAWRVQLTQRRSALEAAIEAERVAREEVLYKLAYEAADTVYVPTTAAEVAKDVVEAWRHAEPSRVAKVFEAMRLLGRPYRYASTGPDAFDCSGFVAALFQPLHTEVFRLKASFQQRELPAVGRDELKVGDLVFFSGGETAEGPLNIGHVAIHLGAGMLVHAESGAGMVTFGRFGWGSENVVAFADPFPATPPTTTTTPPTTPPTTTTTPPVPFGTGGRPLDTPA